MCGRIIGYQVASPDAFKSNSAQRVDGVTITHGTQHIWSYVAGVTEHGISMHTMSCPCSSTNGQEPPSSIGNNHYCESGNPMSDFTQYHLYQDDKLWDGQQCEGTCCTGTNSPPWFSVQLPAPTMDALQVHIYNTSVIYECYSYTHKSFIPCRGAHGLHRHSCSNKDIQLH